jgi:hypothetical protein
MKKQLSIACLATAAALACANASAAIVLSFTPSATSINIGDNVVVDVSISGLGAEVVSGFDLNFLFNSLPLSYSSATYFGGQLGAQTALNSTVAAGNLGFDVVSLELDAALAASQADSFQLFSLTFTGAADGVSFLTLGADPDFERLFTGLNAASLAVDVGRVCIAVGQGVCPVTPVSEPATYGLAGLALAAAWLPGALRRRRVF